MIDCHYFYDATEHFAGSSTFHSLSWERVCLFGVFAMINIPQTATWRVPMCQAWGAYVLIAVMWSCKGVPGMQLSLYNSTEDQPGGHRQWQVIEGLKIKWSSFHGRLSLLSCWTPPDSCLEVTSTGDQWVVQWMRLPRDSHTSKQQWALNMCSKWWSSLAMSMDLYWASSLVRFKIVLGPAIISWMDELICSVCCSIRMPLWDASAFPSALCNLRRLEG